MKIIRKDYKGITYRNVLLQDQKYEGVLSTGDKRHILRGQFKITAISGSYKFGDQIQFIIEAEKEKGYKQETRNAATKDRFEICLDLKHLDFIIDSLKNIKKVIENGS